jgi:hypothetical protein
MYGAGSPQNGSPLAGLWVLVVRGDVASKQFLCKSDGHVRGPAALNGPTGGAYTNFQSDDQISYSVSYPYDSDGKVGKWWSASMDASLPILSDMAPLQGTGRPARDVTASGKTANSLTHQGDGQNVAFGDAHVEFARLPNVGQNADNIFTMGMTGPTERGTQPRPGVPMTITGSPGGYDVLMVPARNEDTGGLW